MSTILDTHAFLWFVNDEDALSATARSVIEDQRNSLYLSVASIWETAIKVSVGKLALTSSLQDFVDAQLGRNEIDILPITVEHAGLVAKLPFPESGHRDPFDRMIIAQSMYHDFAVLTRDAAFDAYAIERLW